MLDKEMIDIAQKYKKRIAGAFVLVNGDDITNKVAGTQFISTKKLDGALQCLIYEEGELAAVSTSGKILRDIPCIQEAASNLKAFGLKSAVIEAELYAKLDDGQRERVGNVSKAVADPQLQNKLQLAPFDILMLDGEEYHSDNYLDTLKKLYTIFTGTSVHPVEYKEQSSINEVVELYSSWVEKDGAEGIVLHNETPIVYKIKPCHTIDAVIVGFTLGEGENSDSVRDMAFALRREDGLYQIVGVTGIGLTDNQKKELAKELLPLVCESEYIITDSRNVAFQMVKPTFVAELNVGDFVAVSSDGTPKINPLLEYADNSGFLSKGNTSGVSLLRFVFVGIRNDKTTEISDIRISQVTDLCPFSEENNVDLSNLSKSEIIAKRVFTKGAGEKLMIQKYVAWKTNKEETSLFPAYVFYYTDFSSGRKEMIKTDIRVSSDKDQILAFMEAEIQENVKKGWTEIE